jgi:DNA-binding MarR family transcriptional regulator
MILKRQPALSPQANTSANDAGNLSDEVLIALRRIIRATDLQSKALGKSIGLTIPQIIVLRAILDMGQVTTGQISNRVSLSQATVTTILDRLESRGLVERYRSARDRRVVHTRLTSGGKRALRKAPPLLHERFLTRFGSLDHQRQIAIVNVLADVADMLGAGELEASPLLDIGRADIGVST